MGFSCSPHERTQPKKRMDILPADAESSHPLLLSPFSSQFLFFHLCLSLLPSLPFFPPIKNNWCHSLRKCSLEKSKRGHRLIQVRNISGSRPVLLRITPSISISLPLSLSVFLSWQVFFTFYDLSVQHNVHPRRILFLDLVKLCVVAQHVLSLCIEYDSHLPR